MKAYAENNFNKTKTLKQLGYKDSTAEKDAKSTIERAERTVKEALDLDKDLTTEQVAQNSLDILGVTREEVVNQLKKIAMNEKDFTNALKVLSVLSRDIGLNIDNTDQNKAPSVNITVEKVEANNPPPVKEGYVEG